MQRIENPTFIQKIVLKKWVWLLFCGFLFSYPIYRALNRELPPELPILSQVSDFNFISDQGEIITKDALKGKIYIASFFCLECEESSTLFENVQKIQKRVRGLMQKIAILSFSMKPETDTRDLLYKKGRDLHTNPYVWKLLTSSLSNQKMQDFVVENFNIKTNDFTKSFALVDSEGNVRSYYSDSKNDINKMMIDIGLLINRSKLKFKKTNEGV